MIHNKKAFVLIGLFLVLSLVLAGCAPAAAPTAEEPAAEEPAAEEPAAEEPVTQEQTGEAVEVEGVEGLEARPLTIAYVHEGVNYQHAQQVLAGANEMAQAFDVELIVTDADFNRDKMIADLDAVIEQQPDAIIIDHGGDGLAPGVERALAAGIPVLTFDNPLPDVEGLTSRVGQDDYDLAFRSLKALFQDLDGEGQIAVIWVGGFAPMERRQRVLNIMLANYPNIEVVATYGEASANTVADTLSKTEAALAANPEIDGIWASWDQFALGAYEALVQAGRTDIPLYSIDISAEDVAKMREEDSPWRATAASDAREVGRVMLRLAVNAAYGIEVPKFVSLPAFLATQEQVRAMPEGEVPTSGPTAVGWNEWLWSLYDANDAAGAQAARAAIGMGGNVEEAAEAITLPEPMELPADFEARELTIAYVHEGVNYQHAQQVLAGANEMAQAFDVELIVTDADFNRDKMIADLDAVIEQQPDAIIIDHGGDGLAPGVERALAAGIPVLTFDNPLPDVEGLTSRVGQDDYDLAFRSLKALFQDLDGEGQIAVIWVGGFAPMERRQRVLNIMLANYPNIEVVATYGEASANTVADTLSKTEAALAANPEIDGIWASWDQFALGAYEALVQAGRTDIPLYSIDISAEDVAKMREEGSPWLATAASDAREVGRVMLRLAINAAYGQEVPKFVSLPAFLATQEQVRAMPEGEVPTSGPTLNGWTPFLVALDELD